MKEKEKAPQDFYNMIIKSWTYERFTKEEKEKFYDLLFSGRIKNALKGNYYQRWEYLNNIYYSFLIGIGYDNFNWRN